MKLRLEKYLDQPDSVIEARIAALIGRKYSDLQAENARLRQRVARLEAAGKALCDQVMYPADDEMSAAAWATLVFESANDFRAALEAEEAG